MAMNQRDYYKQKINKLLPEFPEYIEDFVDTHYDNLSPLTLHRYLETYKNFLTWTIQETISSAENIKDVKLSTLENITKKEMESYFKNLSREEINGKYRTQTTINNYKAAMRSLYKFLTVTSETEQGRAYFERNVMLKIPINRVKETLSSRSKKISEKIFFDSQDEEFLNFVENEYSKIFDEDDFDRILMYNPQIQKNKKLYSRSRLERLAGNSIVVDVLIEIFSQIYDLKTLLYR